MPISRYPSIKITFKPIGHPQVVMQTAVPADAEVIMQYARDESNAVGFAPRAAYHARIRRGHVLLLIAQASPVGFVMIGGVMKPGPIRISQLVVDRGSRRCNIAPRLIRSLRKHFPNKQFIASIRKGLPMNRIAKKTGALLVKTEFRPTRRQLPLCHWIWLSHAQEITATAQHRRIAARTAS